MDIDKTIEDKIVNIVNRTMDRQFKSKLIIDFDITEEYAENIIKSASIANLYLETKGKQECRILGIDNKAKFLDIVLFLSNKHGWSAFENIQNTSSFFRKIRGYKKKLNSYDGLAFLVSKKRSNMVSKNAKIITDDQLATLTKIITENSKISNSEVYAIMKAKFADMEVTNGALRYHIRKIEIDKFKNKHISNSI